MAPAALYAGFQGPRSVARAHGRPAVARLGESWKGRGKTVVLALLPHPIVYLSPTHIPTTHLHHFATL
jgi:hypothetical protein